MSIDDANKALTSEAELAAEIVAVTIKLDSPPHTLTREDFERIWLMGYRAAGGTVHPDEASHPISLAQYASGCEVMRDLVDELRQELLEANTEIERVRAQLDSRYIDATINALLQRVIDGDRGLALAGAERKCLKRWLEHSRVPSSALDAARVALDQASTDFAELRVSIGLACGGAIDARCMAQLDSEGYAAGLRCSKAIDAIDEARKR